MKALRIAGILMLLWAYGMNVHSVIGAWREATAPPEAAAQEHLHDMAEHAGHAEPPPSSAPPSKLAIVLTGVLLVCGAILALWPVRLGVWWGVWGSAVVLAGIAAPRIMNDPRCWVAYDLTKHGCHTFMLGLCIGVTGLVLCGISISRETSEA